MSIVQTRSAPLEDSAPISEKPRWWRLFVLCLLFLAALACNVYLRTIAPPADGPVQQFVTFWLISFLPYLAACLLVLTTGLQQGRWRWLELALVLVGAVILRAMLLPIPPDLSHDSWRYLWDARVTLHGYSPYVTPPGSPVLASLRNFLYENSRFRNVPTIYPPAAQAIYLLSYLIAPSNLFVLKGIFMGFDLVTCGALAYWLYRKGLDPSRVIIYAWCPLPILEFAIQGHLDVTTITFSILALLCAQAQWRGSRVMTGFLIALATLTKFYPILLLLVVLRRRDWALLATCFATIVVAYIPYLILGHGQVFGFFATYASEQTPNAGVIQILIDWIGSLAHFNHILTLVLIYLMDAILVGTVSIITLRLRWQQRISMEAGALILFGAIFAASSHIFPWYTAALLPWIALSVEPVWMRKVGRHAKGIAVLTAWYFTGASITSYFFNSLPSWVPYYFLVYGVTLLGLLVAAIVNKRYRLSR